MADPSVWSKRAARACPGRITSYPGSAQQDAPPPTTPAVSRGGHGRSRGPWPRLSPVPSAPRPRSCTAAGTSVLRLAPVTCMPWGRRRFRPPPTCEGTDVPTEPRRHLQPRRPGLGWGRGGLGPPRRRALPPLALALQSGGCWSTFRCRSTARTWDVCVFSPERRGGDAATSFVCRKSGEERHHLLWTPEREASAFPPHGAAAGRASRSGHHALRRAANGIAGDCVS